MLRRSSTLRIAPTSWSTAALCSRARPPCWPPTRRSRPSILELRKWNPNRLKAEFANRNSTSGGNDMKDQRRKSTPRGAGISRRTLLGVAAASGGALTLGAPFISRALAEEPVRIGVVIAKQGAFVQQGADLAAGLQLALKDASNTVMG